MSDISVWIWDGEAADYRHLQGVCGTDEQAKSACEELLNKGTILSAVVELARLKAGGEILTDYYEYTGYGWSSARRDGKIVWESFDDIREKIRGLCLVSRPILKLT